MKALTLALVLVMACSSPTQPPTTLPNHEPDRLAAELADSGASVTATGTFATEPVGGEGLLYCLDGEELRLYLFETAEAAAAVVARIDRDDPSKMGNAIVAWKGDPRFWHRGPMLVLYLGPDQAEEDLLTRILGPPFAQGRGRGLPGLRSPCASQ